MDQSLLITTTVTIILALVGYFVTYFNNLRLSQRNDKLDRVNKQLGELYGPLYALSNSSDISWKAFRSVNRPGKAYFGEGDPPTEEELKTWRLWITTVFMPTNQRMYELILSKSDLLIESQMPEALLLLCAHVTAYQAVLKRWENEDYSEYISLINYPSMMVLDYAKDSFQKLKSEQKTLLEKANFLIPPTKNY